MATQGFYIFALRTVTCPYIHISLPPYWHYRPPNLSTATSTNELKRLARTRCTVLIPPEWNEESGSRGSGPSPPFEGLLSGGQIPDWINDFLQLITPRKLLKYLKSASFFQTLHLDWPDELTPLLLVFIQITRLSWASWWKPGEQIFVSLQTKFVVFAPHQGPRRLGLAVRPDPTAT